VDYNQALSENLVDKNEWKKYRHSEMVYKTTIASRRRAWYFQEKRKPNERRAKERSL